MRGAAPPELKHSDPSAESAPAAPEGDVTAPEGESSPSDPPALAGVVIHSPENETPQK